MTSVHRLDKFNSRKCDVLCKLSACMGARASFVVTRKSCFCIPGRTDELQTFNPEGRASVFKTHEWNIVRSRGGLSLLGYV